MKNSLTRTRASVRLVHTAISSLVLMSGYRFLWKVASSSCSCWLVKWVLCRLCFFFLDSSAFPSSLLCSTDLSFSGKTKSKLIPGLRRNYFPAVWSSRRRAEVSRFIPRVLGMDGAATNAIRKCAKVKICVFNTNFARNTQTIILCEKYRRMCFKNRSAAYCTFMDFRET